MKDLQVVSSLVQLKALVAGLYGRIDSLAAAAAPAVDFAVDMFDRQDQDTLGPYWSNTEYAIRGGLVIRSAGLTPVIGYSGYLNTINVVYEYLVYNIVGRTTAGAVVYAADLSSTDFVCKITAVVPEYTNVPASLTDAGLYLSHYAPTLQERTASTQVATGAGVCVANSQNAVFGVATDTASCPAQTMTDGGNTAATPDTMVSTTTLGSTAPVSTIEDPLIYVASGSSVASVAAGKHNIMQVGINTLMAYCVGDTVSLSVNGNTLYSATPTTVSRKSRSRGGIMTGPFNAAAAFVVAPNAAVGGTAGFKIWRNDIPEPPNESGHGTYVSGRWQYTDKYHTPVTDSEGNVIRNEDGTVAGYTYDPEA